MDETEQQPSNDMTVTGMQTKMGLFLNFFFHFQVEKLEIFIQFLFSESNGTTGSHVAVDPVATYMPSEALVPMPVLPQSGAVST